MAQVRVVGQMKVASFRKKLEKALGTPVAIYEKDGSPAKDAKKVSQLRDIPPKSTTIRFVGQTKVENIEKAIRDNWGLNVRVLNQAQEPADKDQTLGEVRRGGMASETEGVDSEWRGYLTKVEVMLIDSLSEELRHDEDVASIQAKTIGGDSIQIYCLVDANEQEESVKYKPRTQILSRRVYFGAGIDGKEAEIAGWQLFEAKCYAESDQNPKIDFKGFFLGRCHDLLGGTNSGMSDENRGELKQVIEVIDQAIWEGPQKLYGLQVPGWAIGQNSEITVDDLGAEDAGDLIGRLAINYTPAGRVDDYVIDFYDTQCPIKRKEDGDWPEWHDEGDTLFIYANRHVLGDRPRESLWACWSRKFMRLVKGIFSRGREQ